MNNAFFEKTIENVKNHRDRVLKLCLNSRKAYFS